MPGAAEKNGDSPKEVKKEEGVVAAGSVKEEGKEEAKGGEEEMAPPPPTSAGAAAAGGAKNTSGSDAIKAAVKAGNINIHQEERGCLFCYYNRRCSLGVSIIQPLSWKLNLRSPQSLLDLQPRALGARVVHPN